LGIIPQCNWCPHIIIDYTYSGINEDTLCLTPQEVMQFGCALQCILETILHTNLWYGPVYLIKVDIADGFYCIWVSTANIPKLGIIFPTLLDTEPLMAFPLVLLMGWKESPPYFCATTKTTIDLTNQAAESSDPPPHRLDTLANTQPPPLDPGPVDPPSPTWLLIPEPPHRQHQ
jgi:hypothetical protein